MSMQIGLIRSTRRSNFTVHLMFAFAMVIIAHIALADDPLPTAEALSNKETQIADDSRHSYEIKVINRLLERFHYKDYQLDDLLSQSILDNYVNALDPSRLFFTAMDIEEIRKLENSLDEFIRRGVTAVYQSIFEIYQARVEERIDFTLQRLEHSFDFNRDEAYILDRSEALWASDKSSLDSLWRKRIKNDLINLEISGESHEKSLDTLPQTLQKHRQAKHSNQRKRNLSDIR